MKQINKKATHRSSSEASTCNSRQSQRQKAGSVFEPLESRQLMSTVNGFSLVQGNIFPTQGTVTNQPKAFKSDVTQTWQQLASGQAKVGTQTLSQLFASSIQSYEQQQGLTGYNISSEFNPSGTYSTSLQTNASGNEVLTIHYDVTGNSTTWTSTRGSGPGGWGPSSWDPTFTAKYDVDLTVSLTIPKSTKSSFVSSASAVIANVQTSTSNIFVGIEDLFGSNVEGSIDRAFNGNSQDLSDLVPTAALNQIPALENAEGCTTLVTSVDSSGNLVFTAESPTLTVEGGSKDAISISDKTDGSVLITAGGQTTSFPSGLLKTINVETGSGSGYVNVSSLPAGVTLNIDLEKNTSDIVTVGSGNHLGTVSGTVNVNNSFGSSKTNGMASLLLKDISNYSLSNVTIHHDSVDYNGHTVVDYGSGISSLEVDTGPGGSDVTVAGTAAGVPTKVQTGADSSVAVTGISSSLNVVNGSGNDKLTVGNGSLSGIAGNISVSNCAGTTAVEINDCADTKSHAVSLTSTSVDFKGITTISFGPNVSGVTIYDSIPDNSYDCLSAPADASGDFYTITDWNQQNTNLPYGPAKNDVKVVDLIAIHLP